jgi:hypothetical protein
VNRRALLASAAGALVLGAGCSSLSPSGPESLGDPTVGRPDEGVRLYDFVREGAHLADVDVRVGGEGRTEPTAPAGMVMEVTPYDGWLTESVAFGVRAPAVPGAGEPPAELSLQVPDGPAYPAFDLWRDEDGYARVRTEGLADAGLGDSTVGLSATVRPRAPAEALSLDYRVTCRRGPLETVEAAFTDRLGITEQPSG